MTLRGRLILAAVAVFLLAAGGLAGWQIADRTQPGLCLSLGGDDCAVEVWPHRDGTATVRRAFDGEPVRKARVPDACLRPGNVAAGTCPDWLLDWAPAPVGG